MAPMATIPIDVLYSCILPRLPVKSLTRFKSVSKSWQSIISSREFIRLHHQHTSYSNANRLFISVDDNRLQQMFHVYELDSPLTPPAVHWYNPEPAPIVMSILTSCEFFLLIDFKTVLGLALLNPSTGKYYKIPYPAYRIGYERYAMYIDEANHDYKVIKITLWSSYENFDKRETNLEVMGYSLRNNKWRVNERRLDKCYGTWRYNIPVIIGHLVHILFVPYYYNAKIKIFCFDILAEKWTNDVPIPHLNDLESVGNFTVLDGLLCVEVRRTRNYSVWVMKEYGVKDSWFKLMSIASDDILYLDINPIVFRKGSRHEVLCRRISNKEYIWYNVREKKATTALATIIQGIYGYICKGSLVDFPGGRNMLHQPKLEEETIRLTENYL